ncbi:thioredoxin domain-containing protein [Altererythrobacter xixiisoli]|uniref:Thioredoxin domain-containing protein n=1 Tax=Croceibacterium xixiisoli TaxID=1476466 RepID=A0A6I4TUR6_9SPHN|nr:thioredoxin domain-containing protein [Croceibacterium xixiisoli]MXO99694.1 thioredoxin domain-containing protein [Croceibacterium xixiisoli]
MTQLTFRRLALLAAAPLALAACDSKPETPGELPQGEAIAAIPAPAGTAWTDKVTVSPENGFVLGNPDAPVKLVEYASHTCSHCAQFSNEAHEPLAKYVDTGVVSYELRNLFLNPYDLVIARLVRCAPPEAAHPLSVQVWADLEQIFAGFNANQAALQQASTLPPAQRLQAMGEASGLVDFFAARGISRDQAMQCLADQPKAEALVQASQKQATDLGVTGTPTFFLNGARVDGAVWSVIEPALKAAGAR